MKTPQMQHPIRVREARHDLGWTQCRLANTAKVSVSLISMIEAGYQSTKGVRCRVSEALGRDVEELFPSGVSGGVADPQ